MKPSNYRVNKMKQTISKYGMTVLLILYCFLVTACEASQFDKAVFENGRPCGEVKFSCLPESQNPAWKEKLVEANKMSEASINQMTADEAKKMGELRILAFIDEIIVKLEDEFPGFWDGADKQTRRNWVVEAIHKTEELGGVSRGDGITGAFMFAYLGLDFEQNKDYAPFVKYLKEYDMSISGKMVDIVDYIEWVVFGKDINHWGHRISRWSMRDILNYLPNPKRELPEL